MGFHFQQYLKEKRKAIGLSQLKLSKLLGYKDQFFLSNIENGRSVFPKAKLRRLSRALFVDKGELLDVLIRDEYESLCKTLGIKSYYEN